MQRKNPVSFHFSVFGLCQQNRYATLCVVFYIFQRFILLTVEFLFTIPNPRVCVSVCCSFYYCNRCKMILSNQLLLFDAQRTTVRKRETHFETASHYSSFFFWLVLYNNINSSQCLVNSTK